MNPNDYQSSLTWIVFVGIGGVLMLLLRKRIQPFLAKLKGNDTYGIPNLKDGTVRMFIAKPDGKPRLVVMLTEDMPVQVMCADPLTEFDVAVPQTEQGIVILRAIPKPN